MVRSSHFGVENFLFHNHVGWHPFDKSANNFFTFERDPTLQLER